MTVVFKPAYDVGEQYRTTAPKPDFYLYLMTYGVRITASISTQLTGNKTIYTVPPGKTFFLMTAVLSSLNSHATTLFDSRLQGGDASAPVNTTTLIRLVISDSAADQTSNTCVSINPTIPLKYNSGEILFIFNPSTVTETHGTVTGYEVDSGTLPLVIR